MDNKVFYTSLMHGTDMKIIHWVTIFVNDSHREEWNWEFKLCNMWFAYFPVIIQAQYSLTSEKLLLLYSLNISGWVAVLKETRY